MAPTVIAAAYVLNAGLDAGVYGQTLVRPLIVAMGVVAALTVLVGATLRDHSRTALIMLFAVAAVIGGGVVGTIVTRTAWWQALLWITLVLLAAALVVRIARREVRRGLRAPGAEALNLAATLLLAVVLAGGFISGRLMTPIADLAYRADASPPSTSKADIIVLLLDGYPRADILEEVFGFDNRPFIDALAARGFVTASEAQSNYAWTELTLLSMLHMKHAPGIEGFVRNADQEKSQPWLRTLTNSNPTFAHLHEEGFRVVTIGPGIDHVTLRAADVVLTPPTWSDFEIHLMRSTALAGAVSLIDPDAFAANHRNQIRWGFETLERVATDEIGGRLVFAHIFSPHMPAVFNADGSARPVPFDHTFHYDFRHLAGQSRGTWNPAFVGQIEYVNDRVLAAIDRILEANKEATIIVMSDHGSGSEFHPEDNAGIAERYSTLFSARTPGLDSPFANDQTPVNVFPRLFEVMLDLDLPTQPDRKYFGYLNLVELNPVER